MRIIHTSRYDVVATTIITGKRYVSYRLNNLVFPCYSPHRWYNPEYYRFGRQASPTSIMNNLSYKTLIAYKRDIFGAFTHIPSDMEILKIPALYYDNREFIERYKAIITKHMYRHWLAAIRRFYRPGTCPI